MTVVASIRVAIVTRMEVRAAIVRSAAIGERVATAVSVWKAVVRVAAKGDASVTAVASEPATRIAVSALPSDVVSKSIKSLALKRDGVMGDEEMPTVVTEVASNLRARSHSAPTPVALESSIILKTCRAGRSMGQLHTHRPLLAAKVMSGQIVGLSGSRVSAASLGGADGVGAEVDAVAGEDHGTLRLRASTEPVRLREAETTRNPP